VSAGTNTQRTWLALGVIVLLLITVVLLVRLRSSPEEPPTAPPAVTARPDSGRVPAPPAPPAPAPSPVAPRREPKVTPVPVPAKRLPPPPRPVRAPAAGVREPLGVHTAPAAVPSEIQQETDPVRRAQLQRMHDLAVARSRASRLRRRLRQLKNTLRLARQEGNWPADRIQRTEGDIEQLEAAIVEAERRVGDAEKAAAGSK
jgi:hypothetical protein